MNFCEIFTATIGGIFVLLMLMKLACYVGSFIEIGMHDEEDDE